MSSVQTKQNVLRVLALLVCVVGFFALVEMAHAAFNPEINYQGKLLTSSSTPVTDGTYPITFKLYATSTGGTVLWTENDNVTVTSGLFSVMLGASSTLSGVNFNQTLYLGINVNSDGEMTPRKVLGAVPAAFEANNATTFDNLATTSFLRSDQADTASGLLTFTGGLIANSSSTITNLTTLIATTTSLHVSGNFYDSVNSAGTSGYVLQSTGSGTSWAATSSLGISTSTNLAALTDTTITSPANGNLLKYNGSSWVNVATSSLGLGNGTFLGLTDTPSGYNANRILYETGSGLTDSSTFTFNGTTLVVGGLTLADGLIAHTGAATTTIANNNPFAFTIATSTTASPLFRIDTTAGASTVNIGAGGGNVTIGSSASPEDIVFASSSAIRVVGSGTLTLGSNVTATGSLAIAGALKDANSSAGTSGYILQTTGTSTQWVATSSLGINGVTTFVGLSDTPSSFIASAIPYTTSTSSGLTATSSFTYDGSSLTLGQDNSIYLGTTPFAHVQTGPYNGYSNLYIGSAVASASTTKAFANASVGIGALNANTTGYDNSAFGYKALNANTTGYLNTANGEFALTHNTTGNANTAVGGVALQWNTTGGSNVAVGNGALVANVIGSNNVGVGHQALYSNASSSRNTVIGDSAGHSFNTTGNGYNTFLGYQAGYDVTSGTSNLILGAQDVTGNSITSGSNNILLGLGVRAGLSQTGSNQLNIGNLIFGTGLGTEATLGTGNVGVGSTTPNAKLTLFNTSGGTRPLFQIASSSNGTGTTTNFVVDAYGKVGIGTAAPSGILDVEGGTAAAGISGQNITIAAQAGGTGAGTTGGNIYLNPGTSPSNGAGIVTVGNNANFTIGSGSTFQLGSWYMHGNSSSYINIGTSYSQTTLRINSTNNSIGIATTSTNHQLTVAGDAEITGALYDNSNSAGTNGYVLQSTGTGFNWVATNTLGFISNSLTDGYVLRGGSSNTAEATSSLFIADSGNIGIGTTSPDSPLQIVGNNTLLKLENNFADANPASLTLYKTHAGPVSSGQNLGIINFDGLDAGPLERTAASIMATAEGTIGFSSVPGRLGFFTADASGSSLERMRIDHYGNVSIGTTSTSSLLTVGGSFQVGTSSTPTLKVDTASNQVIFGDGTASSPSFAFASDHTSGLRYQSGGGFALVAGGSDQFILTNGGYFESAAGNGSAYMASAVGSLSAPVYGFKGLTGVGLNAASSTQLNLVEGSANRLTINNGNVGIGTSSPAAKLDVWGSLNVGTSSTPTLYANSGNGYVGIGTANPQYPLQVSNLGEAYFAGGADAYNLNLLGYLPGGSTTTFATGFAAPLGLVFDASGNLYVANYTSGTVNKVTATGTVSTFASGFTNASGLAFDASGNLYVGNNGNGTVSKVTATGTVSTFASGFSAPWGLAFDTSGNLYVANANANTVSKVTATGTVSTFASGFSNPQGIAFDTSGNLYVANANANTVSKVTPGGTVSTFASGFSGPRGLVFDASGNLYVANTSNNTVSRVTPGGTVTTFASGFSGPTGLAFDASSTLYVANFNNNTVSQATAATSLSKLATLTGEDTGVAALRNGTNAQVFRLYNTYTDTSNYERGVLGWQGNSNVFTIGTENAGTGVARALALETANTTRLTITPTGNVGIGTSTPASKLDVWGNLNVGTSSTPTLFANTGNGYVGIGTSSPSRKLTVVGGDAYFGGNVTATGTITATGNINGSQVNASGGLFTSGTVNSIAYSSGSGYFPYWGSGTASDIYASNFSATDGTGAFLALSVRNSSNNHQYGYIGTVSETGASNYTPDLVFGQTNGNSTYTERMRLDQNGNLGIGTTSPSSKLDVWGGLRVGTSSTPDLFVDTTSGRVGIGSSSPAAKLDIFGTGSQLRLSYDGANYNEFTTDSSGVLNLSSKGTSNFYIGNDPTFAGYSDIWPGAAASHTSSNYAWQTKNDSSEVWFNAASGGKVYFTIANNSTAVPLQVRGSTAAVGYAYNASLPGTAFSVNGTTYLGGDVGIGTTTPQSKLAIQNTGLTGNVTAGVNEYFGLSNTTSGAVFYGDRAYIKSTSTATTTLVGKVIRVEDSGTTTNTVRGLEVQADRGANTNGENTAISGFARTFGVRGTTDGDAGGTYQPAGVYGETKGTTQGNALRGYSSTITTADLLSLFQDTSNFAGTGLAMNFGNSTGSFSSTTSKFVDFQNAGSSVFTVSAYGTTTIGDGTTNHMASLAIGYGGLCVDNDGSCSATTTGRISAVSYYTGNSDLAEMYFSSQNLQPGQLVAADGFISVKKADGAPGEQILGVVSTKPGLTLGADDHSLVTGQASYPLALTGRVPVELSDENGPIHVGDPLTLSSIPGVAMKATGGDHIVGYALESFDGTHAYTAGYVNQFGDDIAKPIAQATLNNPNNRDNNPCYNGAGNEAGTTSAACYTVAVKTGSTTAEVAAYEQYKAEQQALAQLRTEPAQSEMVGTTTVHVGSVIMFVARGYYTTSAQDQFLKEITGTSTDLVLGATPGSGETLWSRLKTLAQNFVHGVLTVTGIQTDKVQTKELCVDQTCVTESDLKALLQQLHQQQVGGTTNTNTSTSNTTNTNTNSTNTTGGTNTSTSGSATTGTSTTSTTTQQTVAGTSTITASTTTSVTTDTTSATTGTQSSTTTVTAATTTTNTVAATSSSQTDTTTTSTSGGGSATAAGTTTSTTTPTPTTGTTDTSAATNTTDTTSTTASSPTASSGTTDTSSQTTNASSTTSV